jgi:uncharacterized membrane protein
MKREVLIVILILISTGFLGLMSNSIGTPNNETIKTGSRGNTIIFTDTTWTLANSPYNITQEVQVASEATLTIEPGVQIQFMGDYKILVKGVLIAKGTTSKQILFSSAKSGTPYSSCQLLFKGTDLNKSKLDYLKMEKAQCAIQIGQESEHNQGEKNWGTLTASNIIINEAEIFTDGYDTGAKLIISEAKISKSTVRGNYPRSEEILIKNSIITDSVINSDSYNRGITLEKCNITNSELKLGCCGANFRITDSTITKSTMSHYNDHYYVEIIRSKLIDTPINLGIGRYVSISNSLIRYSGSYGITTRSLIMDSSSVIGSGNGKSTGIIITGNRDNRPNKITNSVIAYNGIGIDITDADSLEIVNCNIINNSNYNIKNKAKVDINATNNYWGTSNKNEISKKIFDYYDDINYGKVKFEPYLTSPVNISIPYIPPDNTTNGTTPPPDNNTGNGGSNNNTNNTNNNNDPKNIYDTDNDGLNDTWELNYFGSLNYGPWDDPDDDQLINLEELEQDTDATNSDTDMDGMPDGWEIEYSLDPLNNDASLDTDNDGSSNYNEYLSGTDPIDYNSVDVNQPITNDKVITEAIDRGDIGAMMWLDDQGIGKSESYLPTIEIELISSNKNSIEFIVRGESESGKVVILNIHSNNNFKITNLNRLEVRLDGTTITSALYTKVLSAQGEQALYCVTVSSEGTQILVYIPHFSEHTVTVEHIADNDQSSESSFFSWVIILILIVVILLIILLIVQKQYIRSKSIQKRRNHLEITDDYEENEESRVPRDSSNIRTYKDPTTYSQETVYHEEYDKIYGKTKYGDRENDKEIYENNYSVDENHQKSQRQNISLKSFECELMDRKEADNFKYSRRDLTLLLETKLSNGAVSEELYNSIMNKIRKLN